MSFDKLRTNESLVYIPLQARHWLGLMQFSKKLTTLTFDVFGTVLDLTGSLEGPTGQFLRELGSGMTGEEFYPQWRARQRIEQFQDSMLMLGHSGYLETCRRALVYALRLNESSSSPSGLWSSCRSGRT